MDLPDLFTWHPLTLPLSHGGRNAVCTGSATIAPSPLRGEGRPTSGGAA